MADKRNTLRDISTIKSFISLSLCFIFSIFIVRFIELFFIGGISNISTFSGFFYGNIISSSFFCLCILILHLIVSLFSKKSALYLSTILFTIIFVIELGLTIYNKSTGMLLGNELVSRPLWETWFTVKTVLNIWIVLGSILLIIAYAFTLLKISKKNISNTITYISLFVILVSAPLFFFVKPKHDKFVVNKISYTVHSSLEEKDSYDLSKVDYDKTQVEKYKLLFPERDIPDYKYPLERRDNINNVLGPYFKKSDKKPDVVVIVVESLGADIFGINDYGYTFTPFLDSLSKHSLLWTNCLSTTPRSFGAVPAVTGSVPHGFKGFQFGDIPEQNSLFSVLKNNDYMTSAFYAGDFSFDKVYDYLIAQKVDFLAPFYEECQKDASKKYDYTYWGWQDKVMFEKSMQIIEKRDENKSYFDMFMTVSQHDNRLRLNDKERADVYYQAAQEIISQLPIEEQTKKNEVLGHLAAAIYGDESIRHFINRYKEFDKDGNTIFIITGDHSLNQNPSNYLDAFHVPLIIWSPMLEKPQTFHSVVSHNDIVPTINALLRDNYKLKTTENIHWVGTALDTTVNFRCNQKTCFLRYTRKIFDGIYDNYYYTFEKNKKRAFVIKENLKIEEVFDKEIIKDLDDKFSTMIYVDNYAYTNNKITKHPIVKHSEAHFIEDFTIDSVFCASTKEKPSIDKPKPTKILSEKLNIKYPRIKIVVTADIKYTGVVWQDQFIDFCLKYKEGKDVKISQSDNISKNIVGNEYHPNKWMRIEFIKTISIEEQGNNMLELSMMPTKKDYLWNSEHTVTLKNVNVSIFGYDD